MEVISSKRILDANDRIAQENRELLAEAGIFTVNIIGSPGAGKTTILESLLPRFERDFKTVVIQGDMATCNDSKRMEGVGVPSIQINTDSGCHLAANMVASAIKKLDLRNMDMLIIENVGNLICPAGFDLGENLRFIVLSVPEGDDKVEKYPSTFRTADAVILNKTDLIPYTDFDVSRVVSDLARIVPDAHLFEVSARTENGINHLAQWIIERKSGLTGSV